MFHIKRRMPMKRNSAAFAFTLLAGFGLGAWWCQPGSSVAQSKKALDLDSVASEVALLKAQAVDQAHVMTSVGYHFTNLWFAGQKKNWPLADFYLNETRS